MMSSTDEGQTVAIGQGESIPSIARDRGFFWPTIWNHGNNAALKSLREDPNVLFEGDEVYVPALTIKYESRATEAKHTFKRKGDPVKFRLQLRKFGEPRKAERYVLEIGGKLLEGTTAGDGMLEQWIPGNVRSGKLILNDGKEVYPISISRLDPASMLSGVQQRLKNLGYAVGRADGKPSSRTTDAIRRFQAENNLDATGDADDATVAKLKQLHP